MNHCSSDFFFFFDSCIMDLAKTCGKFSCDINYELLPAYPSLLFSFLSLPFHFLTMLVLQVHGNVCLSSVVVTQTLDWKLHAFDVLSEFDGNNEAANGPMLVAFVFD